MAASLITVDGLVAVGGPQQVSLSWNTPVDPYYPGGPPYLQKQAIEVWASSTNNRALSAKIGEQPSSNSFLDTGLTRAQTKYYWNRPRDNSGNYGEWHPISPTGGVVGMEANSDLVIGPSDGYWKIPPSGGLIFEYGQAEVGGGLGPKDITFRTPFPHQCLSLVVSPTMAFVVGGGAVVMPNAWAGEVTRFGFRCQGYALDVRPVTGELEVSVLQFVLNYQAWGY